MGLRIARAAGESMSIRRDHGFTLIELSIVLVIIGLIVGGILVGRELIRSATLRAQTRQFMEYQVAMNAFKSKYNCMPGDCLNATAFWPSALNGDGNGTYEVRDENDVVGTFEDGIRFHTWSYSPEVRSYFIQLGLAELVPKQFDGTPVIGAGLPALALSPSSSFFPASSESFIGSRFPDMLPYRRGTNLLWIAACRVDDETTDQMFWWDDGCGAFTPLDMQNIDLKIDDGMPLSGNLLGFSGAAYNGIEFFNCVVDERYDVIQEDKHCQGALVID
jgi:prepilin-type N-terminal cleavage/methylation domain-containing protein